MAKKPTILGYSAGTTLRIGDSLELICRSCDPYPNTTVHWYEMNVRKDLVSVGAAHAWNGVSTSGFGARLTTGAASGALRRLIAESPAGMLRFPLRVS